MRLSELIVECQTLMRKYASEQLKYFGLEDKEAKLYATSCVSQRDIQVWTQDFDIMMLILFLGHTESIYILWMAY